MAAKKNPPADTMESIAPPPATTKPPRTTSSKSATSQTQEPKKKTIAEMVADRRQTLDKQYCQAIETTLQKIYDTAVGMIEKMPANGDIHIIIQSPTSVQIGVFNGKVRPVTVNLAPLESNNDPEYLQQKFQKLLEKMLNEQGFHKNAKMTSDCDCICYCTII